MSNGMLMFIKKKVDKLKINTFESTPNPQSFLSLITAIKGWGEIFPNFKTGTYTSNTDGSVITMVCVVVQPLASVINTLYVPATKAVTFWVVAPLLQL